MKRIPFVLLALLLSGVACSDDSEGPKKEGESDPVPLTLSDPNATEETKALYSNLWAIQSKGFMFGHHDDLMYGRTWYGTEGGSDTKAVCGDYPAVYSFDFAEHIDDISGYTELVDLFTQLPKTYRSVLELKMLHGYTDKEIAKRVGISETAVSSRATRGRTLLREIVEKEGFCV